MNRKNPPVHNHGPEEGLGLACPESVVGGFLQGACVLAAEQTDQFSQSPHMASKYWAELVKARNRIAELEAAAVTAPTEGALHSDVALCHVIERVVVDQHKITTQGLSDEITDAVVEWQASRKGEAAPSDTECEHDWPMQIADGDPCLMGCGATRGGSQPVQVEVTDEMVEKAAQAIYEAKPRRDDIWYAPWDGGEHGTLSNGSKEDCRVEARAALVAALGGGDHE